MSDQNNISTVIKGMGMYLPERIVSSAEVEERVGFKKFGVRGGMIELFTGVAERRYANDNEQPSDLAAFAGKEAMQNAGIDPKDIDMVIFAAVTQDFAEPAVANVVQAKVGASNAFCYDVKNACNSFISALDIADSYIRSGKVKNVLITAGEVFSRMIKLDYNSKEEMLKRNGTFSTGDGGAAFVVSAEENSNRGIIKTKFLTYADYWMHNVVWGGGTLYPRDMEKFYLGGDTNELVKLQFEVGIDFYNKFLKDIDWGIDSISFSVGSQVAKYLTNEIVKRMGIATNKTISILPKYGNIGAASIPVSTYEAEKDGKFKHGDRVFFFSAATGYNVGCAAVNW
ncbi:MAG: ketoacyl-ACP synthase III [Bacillota bacterium]|nr:ketoacyl-ACP synthase III [Bacillota bacterium]